jgi:hypothetical protein
MQLHSQQAPQGPQEPQRAQEVQEAQEAEEGHFQQAAHFQQEAHLGAGVQTSIYFISIVFYRIQARPEMNAFLPKH